MPEKEKWSKKPSSYPGDAKLVIKGNGQTYMDTMPETVIDEILHAREAAEILEEIYRAWLDSEARSGYNHVEITPGDDIGIRLRQWGEGRKGR